MDQLPSLGTEIPVVLHPTYKIYTELLKPNAKAIHSTTRKTFKYGPTERHELDVYTPAKQDPSKPVFVHLHGGGLVAGAKILAEDEIPDGLAYANIGHFFAEKYGFTVVIPNYRLMRHGAKFPSGGEDVALIIEWLQTHGHEIGSTGPRDLFMMGHSAGGLHIATYLFGPFAKSRDTVLGHLTEGHLTLKGVVFLATPFSMQYMPDHHADMVRNYWGGQEQQHDPLGLIKTAVQETGIAKLLPGVKFLALKCEFDAPGEVVKPFKDFEEVWSNSDAVRDLQTYTLAGHNHISPVFGVSTGLVAEEAWGNIVGVFVNTVRSFA